MSANPMDFRRAVEIVVAGKPNAIVHFTRDGIYESTEPAYLARLEEFERARSILAAAVEAHEKRCIFERAPYQMYGPGRPDFEAFNDLCELERGE